MTSYETLTEKYSDILVEYKRRLQRSSEEYTPLYQKIKNSRDAFNQKMPGDIINQASNYQLTKGNSLDASGDDNGMYQGCSRMLIPMYTAITYKTVENLTALPPRYEWDANKRGYEKISRSLERELVKIYTKMNLNKVLARLYQNFLVAGFFVQQTVFKKIEETVRKFDNGKMKEEVIYNGGAIDYYLYDPLTTFIDWDAQPSRIRETSKFIIVTVNDAMSPEGIEAEYGIPASSVGGASPNLAPDVLKQNLRWQNTTPKNDTCTVREYYLNNGEFYTIVNDTFIVAKGYASNGVADQIPINIGVLEIDDDCNLGRPYWERVKWPIAAMSNAFNQVADNNAWNNTAPFFTLGNLGLEEIGMDVNDGRKIFSVEAPSKTAVDITKLITQFTVPEVTNGALMMFERGKESLFYTTGTTDMSFGMQDKQIRNAGVADMISQSLVRSDSAVAKSIENQFLNPVTWDILRIYYTHYDDFGFAEQQIPRDFLKDYKNIRVVNGSYLPSDKSVRLGKLQQTFQLAMQAPDMMRLEELFYDLIEAIGFANPYRYLKTKEEFMAQELLGSIQELLQAGQIDQAQADEMTKAVQLLEDNKDTFMGE